MGRAERWFRSLLGSKKEESPPSAAAPAKPPRRRWSFARDSSRGNMPPPTPGHAGLDIYRSQHAIAVVAEAEATVARVTSSGRCNGATVHSAAHDSGDSCGIREDRAAVKIQAHFRAYLARRALRALRGLVKLQALVRGNIVRKQTTDMLRIAQALLRAQERARAGRAQISESPHSSTKSSHFHHSDPATPEKIELAIQSMSGKLDQSSILKRNGSKSIGRVIIDQDETHNSWNQLDCRRGSSLKTGQTDDAKNDKFLKVDTEKTYFVPKCKKLFQSSHRTSASDQYTHSFSSSKDTTTHQTVQSSSSCEVQSLSPLKFSQDIKKSRGGSSKVGPFTPSRSDDSRSNLSAYSEHPSYMACTESSKAKTRSLSAPKQRPQFETFVPTKRNLVHSYGDFRSAPLRGSVNYASKAYPGSGRLDRLGMPVRGNASAFTASDYWIRY